MFSFCVYSLCLHIIMHCCIYIDHQGLSVAVNFQENFKMQPDMKRLVTSRLKYLTNVGTLVKVSKRRDTLIEIYACKYHIFITGLTLVFLRLFSPFRKSTNTGFLRIIWLKEQDKGLLNSCWKETRKILRNPRRMASKIL